MKQITNLLLRKEDMESHTFLSSVPDRATEQRLARSLLGVHVNFWADIPASEESDIPEWSVGFAFSAKERSYIGYIQYFLKDVLPFTAAEWEDGLSTDPNPLLRILLWGMIAEFYRIHVEKKPIPTDHKREILLVMLNCFVTKSEEALNQSDLRRMSYREVQEVRTMFCTALQRDIHLCHRRLMHYLIEQFINGYGVVD